MMWASDFETTTKIEDCRVWAYASCEIGNEDNIIIGNSLDEFMKICEYSDNDTHYFHNEKFDGEFIISWLFKHNYRWVKDKKDFESKTFTTLISDKGLFYSLEVCFSKYNRGRKNTVKFLDSMKLYNMSVEDISKGFKLPLSKLEIDYEEDRPIGHILTEKEVDYITNDVKIVAIALNYLIKLGHKKMTIGSNALEEYKNLIGKKLFDYNFPPPYYDAEIRQAYKGGFTYLNPEFRNILIDRGFVLDVNSLYPSVMAGVENEKLPYGEGVYYEGKYKNDNLYDLFIQSFSCNFEIKENKIPCLQIKNNLSFKETEYLTSSNGETVSLCLCNVDLKLFFEQYNVYNITYYGGYKFKSSINLFKSYIDKWTEIKIHSKKDGNHALYLISKLFMNSLYGKFASNPLAGTKIPIDVDGVVSYKNGGIEEKDVVYLPIGVFVTAWARDKTIRSAQKIEDEHRNGNSDIRFIYADTDSLHIFSPSGLLPTYLKIDDYTLGAWKVESEFEKARFIRQKTYIEYSKEYGKNESYKINIVCAGMPKKVYQYVTFDNFVEGSTYDYGKLRPKHCKGGIVLVPQPFTIIKSKVS